MNQKSGRYPHGGTSDGPLATERERMESLGNRLDAAAVEAVATELRRVPDSIGDFLKALPQTVNSAYLRAVLAPETAEGAAAWQAFFAQHDGRDPFHLLAYARTLGDQTEAASEQIRRALRAGVRYAFFPRAAKLIAQLTRETLGWQRQCRIAVLGTSTTSLLTPVLKALCFRDRIQAEFYEGLYGALKQEVLDARGGMAQFKPNVVLLTTHWRDLDLPGVSTDETAAVEKVVGEYQQLWKLLGENFGCHVVQHGFDAPAEDAYGYLSNSLPGGRARVVTAINSRMRAAAPSHVSILDAEAVERQTGASNWEDPNLWHNFKQHPSTEALPALGEAQMAHIRAALGLTKKVLVTDLDNTLWKGIIGEDGIDGIQVGPGTAAGEAHQRLQEYMLELKQRGILLAAVSKNNPDDARLPFERHPQMKLKLDDFAAFQANWTDKAQNMRDLAERLSLGLDSFVFLDDNPLEREWIRSQLPQVAVVEPGPNVFHYVRELDRGQYFFALSLSKEDLARAEQYHKEASRENLRAACESLEEFLTQLQMSASVAPVSKKNLARVTQLINKTNQFNLTTRRYTEAQVEQFAAKDGAWAGAFELSDRMGSYGLIGVVLCRPGANPQEWEVDTWLMSCRVLGRQMERFMLDRMVEAAAAQGIRKIIGVYRPTGKNGLVAGLYPDLGFELAAESGDEKRYVLEVPAAPSVTAPYIRNLAREEVSA